MRRLHSILGGITFLLFLAHGILMSFVLYGAIPYRANYKATGIALAVVICIHIIISVIWGTKNNTPASENPFQKQKFITGALITVLFFFHINNYQKGNISNFGGIIAFITELLLLVTCVLHTRFTVRGICYSLNIKDTNKLKKISYISCGIATILLLLMGNAVFRFFI